MRKLSLLWTDSCNGDHCPALYETDGGFVVQGQKLDSDTVSTLYNCAEDEAGVFVPTHIIDRLIDARLAAKASA